MAHVLTMRAGKTIILAAAAAVTLHPITASRANASAQRQCLITLARSSSTQKRVPTFAFLFANNVVVVVPKICEKGALFLSIGERQRTELAKSIRLRATGRASSTFPIVLDAVLQGSVAYESRGLFLIRGEIIRFRIVSGGEAQRVYYASGAK